MRCFLCEPVNYPQAHCFGPVRENTDWSRTPGPGTTETICISCFTPGDPGKEHITNKPPPTGRIWGSSKGDRRHIHMSSQNPSLWNPSWLSDVCTSPARTLRENDWPGTTQKLIPSPKTQDCEPHGRAVLLGSVTLLLSAQMPHPSSLLLCQHVYLLG